MELTVQVEKVSNIVRKLTIKVPAKTVSSRFEKGLAEVQLTAKIKGFRPGQVPLQIVKQYYGDDVRHQVLHDLIDESFQSAVQKNNIKAVGNPSIETPQNKTGPGAHDHALNENEDLSYTATVEVIPEINPKGYTGTALTETSVNVTDVDVELLIKGLLDSQAQLTPVSEGLTLPDGSKSSRPVEKGDFVDLNFSGGLLTEQGLEERPEMKGTRTFEIGANTLIPGFEDHVIGMRRSETKTFQVPFPADFNDKNFAGKNAEFTVTVNELKEKKVPELNDEFAKQTGYESLADMKQKAHDYLVHEKTRQAERKLRSDLLQTLIDNNPFEVPNGLVQAQTRALAQDFASNLKEQGYKEEAIQEVIGGELENLKKRAENQVRASLILEEIAKKENISVNPEEVDQEIKTLAEAMKLEEAKVQEYYSANPARREDLEFRLREDRTVKFLLSKAKIKKD